MKPLSIPATLAVLALAGCSQSSVPAPVETGIPYSAEPLPGSAIPMAPPVPTASAEGSAADAEQTIPVALRGRWGMVPADCTSTRGDAKGLITVDATSIRYYESVAKLTKLTDRNATALRAAIAFRGEGMNWQREVALTLQEGGKALIRQEFGPDASPRPYKYAHCT